ncbi:malate:quinone oxidoreductase [Pseudarthrobacter enclensis]|uniref:Probable malate:quinone oxidoreductase n=1 Tax=Pseudarthrobacter enclensis TaxID=993070 RepID=A0ABT9RTN6_9MICC|nr:malate:quinone oxidoreductase [Pseudarthrobacter enclensis]MDP9888606.1 malate dehydrogenase (quinone) [Pseudarthrobacter enclensis]
MSIGNTPGSNQSEEFGAILIGGGIMSATLGALLATLKPESRILLLERQPGLARESSGPWNNAGTGHAGYCELNYMPDPTDAAKAEAVSRQFLLSREWWAHLARLGLIDPARFIHTTPHMDIVFGAADVDYLRRRFTTMKESAVFDGIEFTDDPARIAQWAPLVMRGRSASEPVAATRYPYGTDVDFGNLTRDLVKVSTDRGAAVRFGHEVRTLRQGRDGIWIAAGRDRASGAKFSFRARFVFVGAGGQALRLMQKARVSEVKGYGVFPVGAAFLRCSAPGPAAQHTAKVYGQAPLGAPPMSVPHLDKRIVDGAEHLLFGPYATFSTKLLKHGTLLDFFTTLRLANLHVLAAAGLQNLPLIAYLIRQLSASKSKKFAQLKRFYPEADPSEWELIQAGQRAQLITPDRRRIGVLQSGTELVTGHDRTIAGLLGASPGASTALPIMLDLLERCFPERWVQDWRPLLTVAIPGLEPGRAWNHSDVEKSLTATGLALGL